MKNNPIAECLDFFQDSEAILIGAGSGLSAAAGLEYYGERFQQNFADYIARYNITDMYSGGFYPYETLEENWGFRSRQAKLNRYDVSVGDVYLKLLELVRNKPYFVITTNVDAQFERAGFDIKNIFTTQGDYAKFQCTVPCHDTLYDNKSRIFAMVEQQTDCRVPGDLVPYCPHCGEPMMLHVRIDNSFVENTDWQSSQQRYNEFLNQFHTDKLLLLELGVGFNTPTIIRFPFDRFSQQFPYTRLIRINKDDVRGAGGLAENALLLQADIAEWIDQMIENSV